MNIFFSYELDDEFRYLTDSKELIAFFNELRQFIKQRLNVLKDEINSEEAQGTKMVVIIPPDDDIPFEGLAYAGYSEGLTKKMKSCITQADIEYLKGRFSERNM